MGEYRRGASRRLDQRRAVLALRPGRLGLGGGGLRPRLRPQIGDRQRGRDQRQPLRRIGNEDRVERGLLQRVDRPGERSGAGDVAGLADDAASDASARNKLREQELAETELLRKAMAAIAS